jgi:hypothetical protein
VVSSKINEFDFNVLFIILNYVSIPINLYILQSFKNRFSSIIFIALGFKIRLMIYFEYIFVLGSFTSRIPMEFCRFFRFKIVIIETSRPK